MRTPFSIFVPVVVLGLVGCGLTDIRPDAIGDTIPAAAAERGAKLLADLQQSHGGGGFCDRNAGRAVLTDDWGVFSVIGPWPRKTTLMQLEWHPCHDTGRITYLDGPARKQGMGIQNWVTYNIDAKDEVKWTENADARFFVPTLAYFMEIPHRIGEADVVGYAGAETWNDKPHTLVFASFGQAAPSMDADQYLLFIDDQTGLLSRVDFTVRETGESMSGTALYSDFQDANGYVMARDIRLTVKGGTGTLHHMKIRNVEVANDVVVEGRLYPDKSRFADKTDPPGTPATTKTSDDDAKPTTPEKSAAPEEATDGKAEKSAADDTAGGDSSSAPPASNDGADTSAPN